MILVHTVSKAFKGFLTLNISNGSVEKAQTGTDWHRQEQTGTDWHRLAQTGTNWHKTWKGSKKIGTDHIK